MAILSLDQMITRLVGADANDGELWHCKSRYVGPLAGHEGLGIVKDDTIIRYEKVIRY